MATPGAGILQIIGAAYGLKQVTTDVIKLVERQASPETLAVVASDKVFGDTWSGNAKTLTVVYRYDGGPARVATAMQGQALEIGAQQFAQAAAVADGAPPGTSLTIWGASYGCADVSAAVRAMVEPAGSLSLVAGDATLGTTGQGMRKAFVIVASYPDQVPFVDIVVEGQTYALAYRPHLQILSAFYGLKDVTGIVQASVGRRRLSIAASSRVFGDGWPGLRKSLHVVYQYADRKPQLATASENETLEIDFDPATPAYRPPLDPRALNVIAAAYGPADVTRQVAALVAKGGLSFIADSATFGDPWPGVAKSFSLVYSWGAAAVSSLNVPERMPVAIAQPEPAFATDQSFVALAGLLAAGDEVKLQTAAGGYWSLTLARQVTALGRSSDAAEVFTVGLVESDGAPAITLRCRDGSYVTTGADGTLRAGGSEHAAARMVASLQINGSIHIGIVGGSGAPFVALGPGGAIVADGSYSPDFSTCFNLLLDPTATGTASHLEAFAGASMLDGPVDMKLVKVVWSLTGGCFEALGFGSMLGDAQQIGPALYRFLRRYPRVMNQIAILIATTNGNREATPGALLAVLRDVHGEGILLPMLRMSLSSCGWVDVSWAIVTLLTKVLDEAPPGGATAAAGLGVPFAGWAFQTTMDMLDYINSEGGAALMLAYERMLDADRPALRSPAGGVVGRRTRACARDAAVAVARSVVARP